MKLYPTAEDSNYDVVVEYIKPAPARVSAEFDLLVCPCCGGDDIGEKGPFWGRHRNRHFAYGCHTCGVVAMTMISLEEAKKRFTARAH